MMESNMAAVFPKLPFQVLFLRILAYGAVRNLSVASKDMF